MVPRAKCDTNSFILLFLCNIFDVQMLLLWKDYFSGCIFHSAPTAVSLNCWCQRFSHWLKVNIYSRKNLVPVQ